MPPALPRNYRLCVYGTQRLTVFGIQAASDGDAVERARQVMNNFLSDVEAFAELHTPEDCAIAIQRSPPVSFAA